MDMVEEVSAAILATGGGVGALWIRHLVKSHGVTSVAFRWATGHHLDGQHRTDAGWFAKGTTPKTHNGRAGAWSHMPRAHRMGIRWTLTAAAIGEGWLIVDHPMGAVVAPLIPVGGSLAGAAWWVNRRIRNRKIHVDSLRPLYEAIAATTGHPIAEPAYNWITLRGSLDAPDANDAKGTLRIEFPRAFTGAGDTKMVVLRAAEVKMDVDLSGSWHLSGRKPYAEFTRAPEPPKSARLSELRDRVDSLGPAQFYVAAGMNGSHHVHDLDRDAPHVAFSGGTGAGKSTFLGNSVGQLYRKGSAHTVICDPKRGDSLPFLEGINGITIYDDIAGMWHGIHWIRREMEYRFDNYTRDQVDQLAPLVLVLDELNMFCDQSQEFWDDNAPKGARKTPPIYKDLRAVAFQGRSRRVFILTAAQNFEAQLLGNAVRDQFGGKAMVRFSPKAWSSIVGLGAKPRVSRLPGRGVWVIGDDVNTAQYLYSTPEEIREYALEREAPVTNAGPGAFTLSQVLGYFGAADDQGEDAGEAWDSGDAETAGAKLHLVGPPAMYSLRQAASDTGEGIVPLKLAALRKRRARSIEEFPAGTEADGTLFFPPAALMQWWKESGDDSERSAAAGE